VINQNIEIKDTGVILEVQPVIRADNSIELHIVQELSSAELAASLSTLTPTVTTRQITSDIMVYSGRTVLLGGLIQDRKDEQKTGIPLLRQAPVVGKLFEQTSTTDTRTEVIVLITPRVARKSGEIERITEQLRQHLRLSGTFPDRPADEAAD
jgi:general secretion pathway protein D